MSEIKTVKKSKQRYKLLKLTTKAILKKNISSEIIDQISSHPIFVKEISKRIWNYFIKYPRIMWWINTYLNDWSKRLSPKEILITANKLAQLNNLTSNDLHYARIQWIDEHPLVREYRQTIELNPLDNRSSNDYSTLLFLMRYIKLDDLDGEHLSTIDDNNSTFLSLDDLKSIIIQNTQECKTKQGVCPLKDKIFVFADSNTPENVENIDLLILGLNPGVEEAKQGKPFVGKSGQLLRNTMKRFLKDKVRYVISNIILCSTPNEKEIPDIDRVVNLCKKNAFNMVKLCNPKVVLLVGDKAAKAFGITYNNMYEVVNQFHGRFFVIYHPSMILRRPQMKDKFYEGFKILAQHFNIEIDENENDDNIQAKSDITWDDVKNLELTFFDCKIIGNQAIWIFLDDNSKKYYIVDEVRIPTFIKLGNLWDLGLVEKDFDFVAYLSRQERKKLQQILRQKMKEYD